MARASSNASTSSHGADRSENGPHRRRSRAFHWNLRSCHDLTEASFGHQYSQGQELEDDSAYDIFLGSDGVDFDDSTHSATISGSVPIRTGIVAGKKVTFELLQNVTQKPDIPRSKRLYRSLTNKNVQRSSWDIRMRLWMLTCSIGTVSLTYFAIYVAMNVVFAGLFYLDSGQCCDDPTLTFAQVFDFTVQTSTTIGYGGYVPQGFYSNFLVVLLSYLAILINTVFAGLLFTKFCTPIAKIEFSEIMTLSNVNGLPCLSIRLGNADGNANPLTDISVHLTFAYSISYKDVKGEQHQFGQTEELKLLNASQHNLSAVWTLRHVLDEASPLFGLNFQELPGSAIYEFRLGVDAVQDITKTGINVQTGYGIEDMLIGHNFQDQVSIDAETHTVICDYAKMNETVPHPVWYPAKAGVYKTHS